jgi:hypothetical protein
MLTLFIPKAQASGTNTISQLQLIPPTSSSGMASHTTELHRYATIAMPQNLAVENGGWNERRMVKVYSIHQNHVFGRRNYI